jgi:hypothetical protein
MVTRTILIVGAISIVGCASSLEGCRDMTTEVGVVIARYMALSKVSATGSVAVERIGATMI